jgi:type IV pilus biogenesis protein CpaD/CtpE
VLKASIASVLALAAVTALSGCAKKENAAAPQAETTAAQPAPKMTEPHPMPAAASATAVDLTGIAKAEGGMTVAEVFADPAKLAGQKVIVRGKVVKTNAGIMGTNWVHVRDGSGAEGSNDLTVTTKGEVPKVGDTVVVSGPASLNKDFGMGYTYPVMLEDATVTVEVAQ